MRLVVELSRLNVERGTGGPFGAAIFEREPGHGPHAPRLHQPLTVSVRLVDVVEDRLKAVLPDPGAVLDVAGALQVG